MLQSARNAYFPETYFRPIQEKQEFRNAPEVSYPNRVWARPGTVFLRVIFRSTFVSGRDRKKSIPEITVHNQEGCYFRKANIKTHLVDARGCVLPGTIPIWSQELQQSAHVCALDAGGSRNVHLATLKQTISDRFFEHSWICWILQCCAGSNCSIMP